MIIFVWAFFVILAVNSIPLFMPATWTLLVFLSLVYDIPFLPLSIIGAIAATIGRVILGMLSRTVLRQYWLKTKTRKNIDHLRDYVNKHRKLGFLAFLTYAFTPLQTSQLFIAYGLTDMKWRHLALPFFLGRLVSYIALTFTFNRLADNFSIEWRSILGLYFLTSQVVIVATIYLFTKIDWRHLIKHKSLRLVR